MTTRWKILVLALVAYAIWMTYAVADLANSAFSQAWDADYHEPKDFAETVWGARDLAKIHMGMVAIGVVAVVALVGDIVTRKAK